METTTTSPGATGGTETKLPEGPHLLMRVLGVLRRHVGRDNAIPAPELARQLAMTSGSARAVRRLISENLPWFYHEQKVAVMAAPGPDGGFYVLDDPRQLQARRRYLNAMQESYHRQITLLDALATEMGLSTRT